MVHIGKETREESNNQKNRQENDQKIVFRCCEEKSC